jgi:hypothetical protein
VRMCAREVHMGDARAKADRGAIPVVRVDTPRESALTRWASNPHPATPGGEDASRLLVMLASLSRACVSFMLYTIVAYVQ